MRWTFIEEFSFLLFLGNFLLSFAVCGPIMQDFLFFCPLFFQSGKNVLPGKNSCCPILSEKRNFNPLLVIQKYRFLSTTLGWKSLGLSPSMSLTALAFCKQCFPFYFQTLSLDPLRRSTSFLPWTHPIPQQSEVSIFRSNWWRRLLTALVCP